MAQRIDFPEELASLKTGKPIPRKSPMRQLRPLLDKEGLIRLGGRLQRALLSNDEKHPLILSKNNYLSLLLVREAHQLTLHGSPQLMRSHLLRRYWILRGILLIKSVANHCVKCARFRVEPGHQTMGQLPPERITPGRPFLNSGVDYAGPI